MEEYLLKKLTRVEKLAYSSKIGRLLANPYRYITGILFKNYVYPKDKKEKNVIAPTFFGKNMCIALPAATDIYLTGGKSHSSEIRLAKFLIRNLSGGDHFLDIGAHYGYFSLLASTIVGERGRVYAFEPASKSHAILRENGRRESNISIFNKAVSADTNTLVFYEFPNLYSEYNTMNVGQFEGQSWFTEFKPDRIEVPATTIDLITQGPEFVPSVIKVDVEGAEYQVIAGGRDYLQNHAPLLIMEYLKSQRHNEEHKRASDLLTHVLGYSAHIILHSGHTKRIDDIDVYLQSENLESDNIVFIKTTP